MATPSTLAGHLGHHPAATIIWPGSPARTRNRGGGSEGVDPAVEALCRPGQHAGITHGVGEQRAALIGGQQVEGKVARVTPAQRPELLLGPFDRHAHQLSRRETWRYDALAEFG